ncbi:MAG: hypothetical protein JL50_10040 [Peptococcaceae bacterium BICA1-7]|nr:MAG: hypothetical protein JL50_10040 [Peptococcaceae bacterium BICA1-7]HBV95623.1 hypothetical protein [Desulfotomaculum sp.]
MLELVDLEILTVEEVKTLKQNAIVKRHYCMLRKITVSAPRTSITAGEQLTIAFQWQRFSLAHEAYENDPAADPITFKINDQAPDTMEPVDGMDTLTFTIAEPGIYTIKTLNPGVDNAALEVVVSA